MSFLRFWVQKSRWFWMWRWYLSHWISRVKSLVRQSSKQQRIWVVNSAVECHLHTVEASGSIPLRPTRSKKHWWTQCFFCFKRQQLAWKKRINFLALQAINPLPSYLAQPSCVKVRCRAFLMPARFARLGTASVKNWATKNLGEVLSKSGWWFLLGTHHPKCYSQGRGLRLLCSSPIFISPCSGAA